MTIQRKYSLPNCTLLLEGLNDSTNVQSSDARPLISMLVNAECHLAGANQPLTGGRDFFESLVSAVSAYAQEFLSKVHHPQAHRNEPGLVQLQKLGSNRHRLIVNSGIKAQGIDAGSSSDPPTQIDLTTVQLFDLVEAVDQFFADSQTLPELSLQLSPVSKRYVDSSQLMVKQAVPAAVGVSGLALAAIAFFLVPIPSVRRPPEPRQQQISSTTPIATRSLHNASPTPPTPAGSNLAAALATAPEITDASQLHGLNRKLYSQINQAWKPRSKLQQNLVYRVGVNANGAIIGYDFANPAAHAHINQTPLPKLKNPASSQTANPGRIAQFKVVFTNQVLQVSPWRGYKK